MGTRHLIAVQIDGDYKVAQYGQWDGYPSGQGADVLKFLRSVDLGGFKEKVRGCRFLSAAEIEEINNWIKDSGREQDWQREYPHLSRDAGADVLWMIYNSDNGLSLKDSISFARDSRFCEYAYVIDLDSSKLEVHKGFVKDQAESSDRFKNLPKGPDDSDGYYPVRLAASYDLSTLPTVEQMEIDVDGEEDS